MDAIILPVVTFGAALLAALIIYWFGGLLSPMYKEAKYKRKSYACGEEMPASHKERSYNLFHVAFLFTILHVGVLLVATAPTGEQAWLGVLVAAVVAVSAGILILRGGEHDA